MTMKGNLNRVQAIQQAGAGAVLAIESENCEPTGRVGYNGECQGDSLTEWAASIVFENQEGEKALLIAYYYTTNGQDDLMAESGDGGAIDWAIEAYEIV